MKKTWKSWLLTAIPYLLTALIPVISVLFLGNTVLTTYEEKLISEKQSSLQAAIDRMQQKSDTIEQMAVMLANNDVLNRYSSACMNRSGHTALDFIEVKQFLSNVTFDSMVHDIFIYDKKDNCAISPHSAQKNTANFFRYYYPVKGLSLQESMDRLDQLSNVHSYSPEISLAIPPDPNATVQIVEYRMFLPIGWVRDAQCQLVVAIDAEELFRDFRDALPVGGEFYVYDRNNVLIYSSGSQYKDSMELTDSSTLHALSYKGTRLHGAVLRDDDWKVKVFIPDLINESSTFSLLSPSFILFVILPMLLCMLLALAFSNRDFRGVQDLLSLFSSHTEEHPGAPEIMDYRLVRRYVSQVIAEKNQMTQRITQYSDSRKYEVLDKLVRNTYDNRQEAAQALDEVSLNIRQGRNIVVCIRCPEISYETVLADGTTIREMVRQLVGELLEQPYVLFDTATNETTCIISLEEVEDTEFLIQTIISQLNVELAYRYDIEVNIGVGNPAPSVFFLHESYSQAHRVLHYREAFGSKVTLFSELQRMENAYYYPREYSERISHYIIAGKQTDAKHLIWQIYEENFENSEKHLSTNAIGKLKQNLWDCIHALSEKYNVALDEAFCLQSGTRPFFDAAVQSVDLLTQEIQHKQKQVRHKTASRLLEYVEQNFCDNTLSLKQISETFGMHESYISNVFKNALGENLSVYIERLRIEKAREMVKNTDMKVQEIAEAVGYTSDASFRRAFKKIIGVSPVEYREQ